VILRDVTERKQAEQDLAGQSQELVKQASEIRKLNDELEQRVLCLPTTTFHTGEDWKG
jgi:hypothetical protein